MSVAKLRWIIQSIAFLVLMYGGGVGLYLGSYLPTYVCHHAGSYRSGNCFYYILQRALESGTMARFLQLGPLLIFFSILVILIGRAWCGWICPLGYLQDLLDLARRNLKIGYLRFPQRVRSGLGIIKWAFVFILLLVPLWVAYPLLAPSVAKDFRICYCTLCPAKYILPLVAGNPEAVGMSFGSPVTITLTALGFVISALTVCGAFVKRRFWCAYCPMGFVLSWYKKIAFLKLKKNSRSCTGCEACYNACPMDIEQIYKERDRKDVTFTDCILCLKCIDYCPEDDALGATFLGKTIYRSTRKGFFSRRRIPAALPEQKKKSPLEHINNG